MPQLPVECTEASAMHVMCVWLETCLLSPSTSRADLHACRYMLRYYQDFPVARLAALEASGSVPPAGAPITVDWTDPAASALRRTCAPRPRACSITTLPH